MQILNFLLYWASRVYEWFGSLYEQGRDVTLNALSWIYVRANDAFLRAVNWAYDSIQRALGTAWIWVIEHYNDAINYVQYVRAYLIDKFDDFFAWVNARIEEVSGLVDAWVQFVIDLAAQWVNDLRETVQGWIADVREFIAALINISQDWLLSKINGVWELLTTIRDIVLGRNGAGTPILLSFLSNPFGFIMAYVWHVFVDLICYGLAYGMGTVKYDLPDIPDWNGGGLAE